LKIINSVEEMHIFGEDLAHKLKIGDVVFLIGGLGAGKTTLTQGIAKGLGVKNRIVSPTFTVARDYGILLHIDAYRSVTVGQDLSAVLDELEAAGLLEDLVSKITVIEWGETFAEVLAPHNRYEVNIEIGDKETERKVDVHYYE
jgi:tRNA threonylcarbamoyl adenosine modification protein YjeE